MEGNSLIVLLSIDDTTSCEVSYLLYLFLSHCLIEMLIG